MSQMRYAPDPAALNMRRKAEMIAKSEGVVSNHQPDVVAQLVEAAETLLLNDGGEGSKCFNAMRTYDARVALRDAIAAVRGE